MTNSLYVRLEPTASPGAARFKHLLKYSDDFQLLEGMRLADEFPDDAAYQMNRDFPKDITLEDAAYNLDNQLVVGARLRAFLESRVAAADLEFLPVTLVNHKDRAVAKPYAVANVLRHVDAVDQQATTHAWNALDETAMIDVKNLTVDPARVPADAVLFRLVHVTDVIGIRRDVAEAMQAEGFTGISFPDFADYRG